ncbi:MAG: response regulator [Pseudomonadota bacterium]|nr:response regulator [Pseudomonadota bacterium]
MKDRCGYAYGDREKPLVVILEDDRVSGWAMEMILRDAGYKTLLASAGEDALQVVRSKGVVPASIISDFHLGGRMNGLEAANAIARVTGETIPTIITSHRGNGEATQGAAWSGYSFCPKPIDPATILDLVAEAVAGR